MMATRTDGRCGWAGADPLYVSYHDTMDTFPTEVKTPAEQPQPRDLQGNIMWAVMDFLCVSNFQQDTSKGMKVFLCPSRRTAE